MSSAVPSAGALPLIGGAHGLTLYSTGQVLLREDWEYVAAITSGEARRDTARAHRLTLALNHESIHFIQTLTIGHLVVHSLALLSACVEIAKHSRNGRLTRRRLLLYVSDLETCNFRLFFQTNGLSVIDLIEAVAVVESFLSTFPNKDADDFLAHLDDLYPGVDHAYRRVINVVCSRFGLELGLRLISPLAFFALNTSHPVPNFYRFLDVVDNLPKGMQSAILEAPLTLLAKAVGIDFSRAYRGTPERLRQRRMGHPFNFPYIELLGSIPFGEFWELAARPGRLVRGEGPATIAGQILPPLILCNGGRGLWQGIAKNWSEPVRQAYLAFAAQVGVVERLISDKNPYQFCPYTTCPMHNTALCHGWYAVPEQEWQDCGFPGWLQSQFGAAPDALMAIRATTVREEASTFLDVPYMIYYWLQHQLIDVYRSLRGWLRRQARLD